MPFDASGLLSFWNTLRDKIGIRDAGEKLR
jgi:hypothetical protein